MIGEKKQLLQVGHAKTACHKWVSSDVVISKRKKMPGSGKEKPKHHEL